MVCSCFVFIRAQYSQSQCDVETSREGWVERGEKACWWVDYWRWRLVGPRRKRCRFENACYRKGDASHIHTHTHAQTSGFPARDRVQGLGEGTSFRHFIVLNFNLILRNHSVPISPLFRNSIYPYIFNFCLPSIVSVLFSSSVFLLIFLPRFIV